MADPVKDDGNFIGVTYEGDSVDIENTDFVFDPMQDEIAIAMPEGRNIDFRITYDFPNLDWDFDKKRTKSGSKELPLDENGQLTAIISIEFTDMDTGEIKTKNITTKMLPVEQSAVRENTLERDRDNKTKNSNYGFNSRDFIEVAVEGTATGVEIHQDGRPHMNGDDIRRIGGLLEKAGGVFTHRRRSSKQELEDKFKNTRTSLEPPTAEFFKAAIQYGGGADKQLFADEPTLESSSYNNVQDAVYESYKKQYGAMKEMGENIDKILDDLKPAPADGSLEGNEADIIARLEKQKSRLAERYKEVGGFASSPNLDIIRNGAIRSEETARGGAVNFKSYGFVGVSSSGHDLPEYYKELAKDNLEELDFVLEMIENGKAADIAKTRDSNKASQAGAASQKEFVDVMKAYKNVVEIVDKDLGNKVTLAEILATAKIDDIQTIMNSYDKAEKGLAALNSKYLKESGKDTIDPDSKSYKKFQKKHQDEYASYGKTQDDVFTALRAKSDKFTTKAKSQTISLAKNTLEQYDKLTKSLTEYEASMQPVLKKRKYDSGYGTGVLDDVKTNNPALGDAIDAYNLQPNILEKIGIEVDKLPAKLQNIGTLGADENKLSSVTPAAKSYDKNDVYNGIASLSTPVVGNSMLNVSASGASAVVNHFMQNAAQQHDQQADLTTAADAPDLTNVNTTSVYSIEDDHQLHQKFSEAMNAGKFSGAALDKIQGLFKDGKVTTAELKSIIPELEAANVDLDGIVSQAGPNAKQSTAGHTPGA